MQLSGYDDVIILADEQLLREFDLIKNMENDIGEINDVLSLPFSSTKIQKALDLYQKGDIDVQYYKIYNFLYADISNLNNITSYKTLVKQPKLLQRYYNMTNKLASASLNCRIIVFALIDYKILKDDKMFETIDPNMIAARLKYQIMTNSKDEFYPTLLEYYKNILQYKCDHTCCSLLDHPETVASRKFLELNPNQHEIAISGCIENYSQSVLDYAIYHFTMR